MSPRAHRSRSIHEPPGAGNNHLTEEEIGTGPWHEEDKYLAIVNLYLSLNLSLRELVSQGFAGLIVFRNELLPKYSAISLKVPICTS